DPEGHLLARALLDGREVDEHPLRGLGAQVRDARLVLDRAHVRLEHHVELARLGERVGSAVRASPGCREMVLPEPLMAVEALDERIVEAGDVAARLPDPRGHDDRGLEPDDVVPELHHRAPPRVADVPSELDPERPVVPARAQSAVDLAGLERDPPAFREGGDGLHEVGHGGQLLSRSLAAAAGVRAQSTVEPRGVPADTCGEMTASRTCRACGAGLPGEVMWCLRCYEPVRQLTPRDPGEPTVTFLRDHDDGPERSRWKGGVNTFGPFGRVLVTVLVLLMAPLSLSLVSIVVLLPCYLVLASVVLH